MHKKNSEKRRKILEIWMKIWKIFCFWWSRAVLKRGPPPPPTLHQVTFYTIFLRCTCPDFFLTHPVFISNFILFFGVFLFLKFGISASRTSKKKLIMSKFWFEKIVKNFHIKLKSRKTTVFLCFFNNVENVIFKNL